MRLLWSADRAARALQVRMDRGGGFIDPLAHYREHLQRAYEAGKREALAPLPEVSDLQPLVLYFKTAADRQEMVDAIAVEKPGMIEFKIP